MGLPFVVCGVANQTPSISPYALRKGERRFSAGFAGTSHSYNL